MTPANITALQALVQADPALAQQLQSAATPDTATQLLAQAASQKGLAVDTHAIADYLKTAPTARMTDGELEAVAGGWAGEYGTLSIDWGVKSSDGICRQGEPSGPHHPGINNGPT